MDRGALEAALSVSFPCGGYRARTRKNVQASDGTVILAPGELTGGSALTLQCCRQLRKPHLVIDAAVTTDSQAAQAVGQFVEEHRIGVLNVAGPRASGWPDGWAGIIEVAVVMGLLLEAGGCQMAYVRSV